MDPQAITAVGVICAALVSGWFGYVSHKGRSRVDEMQTVLTAYDEIVKNLQSEVMRLSAEVTTFRNELADCEERSENLRREIDVLKREIQSQSKQSNP